VTVTVTVTVPVSLPLSTRLPQPPPNFNYYRYIIIVSTSSSTSLSLTPSLFHPPSQSHISETIPFNSAHCEIYHPLIFIFLSRFTADWTSPGAKHFAPGAFLWRAHTKPFPSFYTTTIRSIYTILYFVLLNTFYIQPRYYVAPFCASLRHATLLNPVALHPQSPLLDTSSVRQRLLSIQQWVTRNLSRPSISSKWLSGTVFATSQTRTSPESVPPRIVHNLHIIHAAAAKAKDTNTLSAFLS
jgi:hypothetical protein